MVVKCPKLTVVELSHVLVAVHLTVLAILTSGVLITANVYNICVWIFV